MHGNEPEHCEAGPSAFGQLLRRRRREAGLTQEALAERSGVSVQAIAALESGRRRWPRRDTVLLLAGALDLDLSARDGLAAAARARFDQRTRQAVPLVPVLPSGPLIGRERELDEIRSRLASHGCRLITLTGPPGVGKTRLALKAASELPSSLGLRVVSVDLASLAGPELVGIAIRQALGLRDAGAEPLPRTLAGHLRDQDLVLLLDNFEHVLPASTLLAELMAAAPGLRPLVTSRAPLRLRDEEELPVRPLPLPEAVRLFVLRAQARSPDFERTSENGVAVEAICRRLDGLPLALELAAPWMRLLSPEELAMRLESGLGLLLDGSPDLPQRQRTMRHTLAWSCGLLPPHVRSLLWRASVFPGGATLDALQWVCRPALDPDELLRAVGRLVDHSLLLADLGRGALRVGMLMTFREYGREQLQASGDLDDASRAQAEWCLRLAKAAEPHLPGPAQREWLARLDPEHDNLRAALAWARDRAPVLGLDLASTLRRYWLIRGHLREGATWLGELLARAAEASAGLQAKAMTVVGDLQFRMGENDDAAAWYTTARTLWQSLDDDGGVAETLEGLAAVAFRRREGERAASLNTDALCLRRAAGDLRGMASSLHNLGLCASAKGDERRADAYYEEALSLWRRVGDGRGIGITLVNLGSYLGLNHAPARAIPLLREAIALGEELGDDLVLGQGLAGLAETMHLAGRLAEAAAGYRSSLLLSRKQGDRYALSHLLERLGGLAWTAARAPEAARLLGAAEAQRAATGILLAPDEGRAHDHVVSALRASLGTDFFAAAWREGENASSDAVVDEALRLALDLAGGIDALRELP